MADASDTSTTEGSGQPELAALGILLVHGIGEQAQGETLTKFAEPIVDWMRDWLHRESAEGSRVASTPVDAGLRPPLLPQGTPAHARVVIGAAREDAVGQDAPETVVAQEWLFAEAWWGPQVLTPPIGGFTMWLVTRGPWLMMFHFNQRLLASRSQHNAWKWLIGIPLSVVWVVLSLLLSAVLVAASLIAVIPIGRVRRAVYAVLRAIAGVVGDAYGQLRSSIQRAAFERATLDAMEWLRPKCHTLAVIAHSQGAAIAHRALQNGVPQADLLVTVGAGITKLEALRYLERLGPSDRIAGFLAPLLLVAGGVVALRAQALGLMDIESRVILPGTLVIVGLAFLAQVWITVRRSLRNLRSESQRLSLTKAQPDLSWMDIVGTHDPVPAGELKDFFDLEKIESHRIPILRSWLADHTSYWTARASFMEVLVPRLAQSAKLEFARSGDAAEAGVRSTVAQKRLRRDLLALTIARWLDAIALVIPLLIARDRLIAAVEQLRVVLAGRRAPGVQGAPLRFIEDTITNVELALRWTADVIAGDAGTWARPIVNLAVALLLVALALVAWRRLEFAVWRAWSAGRNEKALRGPLKVDGLPKHLVRQARLFAVLSATFANTAMGATLLMGITVSAAWSFAPAWANEAGVYRLLGSIAGGLFALLMLFSQVVEWAEKLDSLRDRWRRWRGSQGEVTWPSLRAGLSRVTEAAIGLLVVWLMIDQMVTLPAILKPEIIFIGVLALLRGFLALLDAIWQRLDSAGARARTKVTLLTLPIAIGAAVVAGFSFVPHTEPLQVSGILSGAVVVGCIAAGVIMLALRMTGTAR